MRRFVPLKVEAASGHQLQRFPAVLPLRLQCCRTSSPSSGFDFGLCSIELVRSGAHPHPWSASSASGALSAGAIRSAAVTLSADAVWSADATLSACPRLTAARATSSNDLVFNGELLIILSDDHRVAFDVFDLSRQSLALALV